MGLRERVYSVLVVSATEKMNTALSALLSEARFDPIDFVPSVNAARRSWSERGYDCIIVNSPLPDDAGVRFAIDATAESKSTVVLLLVRPELYEDAFDKVMKHGVFTLAKPVSRPILLIAFDWMESAGERLRRLEKETTSFEEKMEEIRLVNRAKWLLISALQMDEPAAHRYIEKLAMDRCVSKKTVAQEILRTYG